MSGEKWDLAAAKEYVRKYAFTPSKDKGTSRVLPAVSNDEAQALRLMIAIFECATGAGHDSTFFINDPHEG